MAKKAQKEIENHFIKRVIMFIRKMSGSNPRAD